MSFKQKLKDEVKAIGVAALYFGCWIGALLLLKSLILAEYKIAFHGWSVVVVGALVLSKVVLVLEHVSLGAWLCARPACVDVVLRTVMYTLGVAIVLGVEKGFEGRHEYGGFGAAVRQLFQQEDVYHLWANTLCLSGALLGYNMLSVVRRYLSEGGLLQMFFSSLPGKTNNKHTDTH
jgi:hypothetical protein